MNSVQQRSLLHRNSAPLMRRITPLHIAAAMGYAPVAEVLLSFGADASSKNSKGCDNSVSLNAVLPACCLLLIACCLLHWLWGASPPPPTHTQTRFALLPAGTAQWAEAHYPRTRPLVLCIVP